MGPNQVFTPGVGWGMTADSIYESTYAQSVGPVAPSGAKFAKLKVWAINGGTTPAVEIRNGKSPSAPLVATVAATALATIDHSGAPDLCSEGMFLTMTGAPQSFEIEVLWK